MFENQVVANLNLIASKLEAFKGLYFSNVNTNVGFMYLGVFTDMSLSSASQHCSLKYGKIDCATLQPKSTLVWYLSESKTVRAITM